MITVVQALMLTDGNIMDMEAYDRYQHSFLFTFGNQLIQGYSGTDKQYNAYSYSDIPKANFRVNIPENSTYTWTVSLPA